LGLKIPKIPKIPCQSHQELDKISSLFQFLAYGFPSLEPFAMSTLQTEYTSSLRDLIATRSCQGDLLRLFQNIAPFCSTHSQVFRETIIEDFPCLVI